MPLLVNHARLLRFRCSNTPSGCLRPSTFTRQQRTSVQTAAIPTSTDSAIRPSHSLRSPVQWSHVVYRIRTPPTSINPTVMGRNDQTRTHMGHSHGSHGHHHHHDNTFLTSTNRSDPGVRITRIGLYVNLGMAIVKGAGGYIFNSQAYVWLKSFSKVILDREICEGRLT